MKLLKGIYDNRLVLFLIIELSILFYITSNL